MIQYLLICIQNLQIHTSISYPYVATQNSAAKCSLLRLRRICSDSDTFDSRARELTDQLCKRGYQKQKSSLAIERAWQQKREDLLSYRPKSESNILPFVLTYHPDLQKVRDIVNKHWPIIESSSTLSEIFTERPTTEDPRVCGIFLYLPISNQTCVMMNHLGRHDRATKQDAKPAK